MINFIKFANKIKIKINSNNKKKYNLNEDIIKAHKNKEINKMKNYDDQYHDDFKNNLNIENQNKYIVIDGCKMNDNVFNPDHLNFPEINYVNIPPKQRRMIVKYYGNIFDKYLQIKHQNSNKIQKKQNKKENKNNNNGYHGKHYKNKNNKYRRKYNNNYNKDF